MARVLFIYQIISREDNSINEGNRFSINEFISPLRPSNTGNIFLQLVVQQCCRCKLRLFVARITTFSRNRFSCCRK